MKGIKKFIGAAALREGIDAPVGHAFIYTGEENQNINGGLCHIDKAIGFYPESKLGGAITVLGLTVTDGELRDDSGTRIDLSYAKEINSDSYNNILEKIENFIERDAPYALMHNDCVSFVQEICADIFKIPERDSFNDLLPSDYIEQLIELNTPEINQSLPDENQSGFSIEYLKIDPDINIFTPDDDFIDPDIDIIGDFESDISTFDVLDE